MVTPTHRMFGRTKIDSLDLDSSAWYIDDVQVTASASDLNAAIGTCSIYNNTGGSTADGMLLHISGYNAASGYFVVEKADATNSSKPAQLIAAGVITSGSTGLGYVRNDSVTFNTLGATAGDAVYLDTTAGAFTLSQPTDAGNLSQIVGRVMTVSATGTVKLDLRFMPDIVLGSSALQGKSVTAAKLGSDVAGTGLSGGNGSAVALSLNGLSAATVDVAADSIAIIDANDTNASKKESIADLVSGMAGTGLSASSGQLILATNTEPFYSVYSAVALAVGDLLHVSGSDGTTLTVEKADADTSGKPAQLVATAINAGGTTSLAKRRYTYTPVDTSTAGAAGDPVYLDAATAGGFTFTAPTGADQIQQIVGRVSVKNAAGSIIFELNDQEMVKVGTSALQNQAVTPAKLGVGAMHVVHGDISVNVDTAVDTDLGVIGVKGDVVMVQWHCETAADKDTTFSVSKAAAAASKVSGDNAVLAIDAAPYKNTANALSAVDGTGSIAATDHLYLYANASGGRSAGVFHALIYIRVTA